MARAKKPTRSPAYRKLAADDEACGGNLLHTLFPEDDERHRASLARAARFAGS